MSVFDNMAFGLKLRKMPKDEIKRRVDEAARVLEITDYLDRKPKALSGGQRQRVAMGRAIVREPAAFLMDEPLSNLDAKLRVQMRTELGLLHSRLKTTTIYVTHDQIEAMTLGHRVAVIRKGTLQQVAPPSELFHRPTNLFVAGFIGSPAMNVVNGRLEGVGEDLYAIFGENRIKVDPRVKSERPGLVNFVGKDVIIGLRPGDFEDVAFAAGDTTDKTMQANIEVTEVLGSETLVHFMLPIPPVITPDIEELLADSGADAASLGDETKFSARVNADSTIGPGSHATLAIDTSKMHFFDPATGDRIE
jgi:multiple sugar transport system ATP-binding protein